MNATFQITANKLEGMACVSGRECFEKTDCSIESAPVDAAIDSSSLLSSDASPFEDDAPISIPSRRLPPLFLPRNSLAGIGGDR